MRRPRCLDHEEYLETTRFGAFDGLRAIVCLMVIAGHFGGWLYGYVGIFRVHVFFVLSGFLITRIGLREEDRDGRLGLRGFYVRRMLRIMPAYYLVLLLTVVVTYGNEGEWASMSEALPYYLLFGNEFHATTSVVGLLHSWTIGIEQKFYLVWPLLFVLLGRLGPVARTLSTVGMIGVSVALIDVTAGWSTPYTALLVGCLLAQVLHLPRGYALLRPVTHPIAAVLIAAGFVPFYYLGVPGMFIHLAHYSLVIYNLGIALLLVALFTAGPVRWLLTTRPMAFIGQRSYSLYLVHGLAGAAVVATVPTIVGNGPRLALGTAIAAILAADLLYRHVELPSARLARHINRWFAERTGPGAPGPRQAAAVPEPREGERSRPEAAMAPSLP